MPEQARYSKATIILTAVLAGALLAFGIWLRTSSGEPQNDPQRTWEEAVLQLKQAETLTITTQVTSGEFPWQITRTVYQRSTQQDALTIVNRMSQLSWYRLPNSDSVVITSDASSRFNLSATMRPLLDQLADALQDGGMITDVAQIEDWSVINAVAMEQTEGRILRHFQIAPDSSAMLPSLIGLLRQAGLEVTDFQTAASYQYPLDVLLTEVWIDEESGRIERIVRDLEWSGGRFSLTTTFEVESDVSVDEAVMVDPPVEGLSWPVILDHRELLAIFGYQNLSDQLADAHLETAIIEIRSAIAEFAEQQLFYPSVEQFAVLLSTVSPGDAVIGQINYQPDPFGCDNQPQRYCATYQLTADARFNGLGSPVADSDLRFTP